MPVTGYVRITQLKDEVTMASTKLEPVYVELDALLDTRLATLARMGEDVASKVLESGYLTRKSDDFSFAGVDKETYRTLYETRDENTLALSTVTNAIQLLKRLTSLLTEQAIVRPFHDGGKIVVNTFPYSDLTSEERDTLGKAIAAWTRNSAPIELVHIHPKDLTPQHCKNSYSAMIVYEYEDWLNMHTAAFEQCLLSDVTMFAPAIYFAGFVPTAEELEKITREADDPFRAMERLASPLINLQLIDVSTFSILQNHTARDQSGIFAQPSQPAAPRQSAS